KRRAPLSLRVPLRLPRLPLKDHLVRCLGGNDALLHSRYEFRGLGARESILDDGLQRGGLVLFWEPIYLGELVRRYHALVDGVRALVDGSGMVIPNTTLSRASTIAMQRFIVA